MEDSTRTKESFRNAAEFHGLKVNVFDAKTSSFQLPGTRKIGSFVFSQVFSDVFTMFMSVSCWICLLSDSSASWRSLQALKAFRSLSGCSSFSVDVEASRASLSLHLRKNETITDTIKMLCGYSTGQSLFVIRSKVLKQGLGHSFLLIADIGQASEF